MQEEGSTHGSHHLESLNASELVALWVDSAIRQLSHIATNEEHFSIREVSDAAPATLWNIVNASCALRESRQHGRIIQANSIVELLPFEWKELGDMERRMRPFIDPAFPDDFHDWYDQEEMADKDSVLLERWRRWIATYFDQQSWVFESDDAMLEHNRGVQLLYLLTDVHKQSRGQA